MQKKVLKRLKELRFQYVKRYYIFVPLTVIAVLIVASSAAILLNRSAGAAIDTTNLVSFWNLNEESGTRYDAVVASANDLTESGSVGYQLGYIDKSAAFDGSNYLTKATNASLENGGSDFSVSFWVKFNDVANSNSKYFVSKYNEWSLFWANGFYFRTYTQNSPYQKDISIPLVGQNDTWYFLVAIHDAATNTNTIILNDSTTNSVGSVPALDKIPGNFQIGAMNGAGLFNGSIDAVGFWKRKLTAGEITELYGAGGGIEHPFVIVAPSVTTATATSVTHKSAWLQGNISSLGGQAANVRGFKYDTDSNLSDTPFPAINKTGSFSSGVFGQIVLGLTCDTDYYFQAYAANTLGGTGSGAVVGPFHTQSCTLPDVNEGLISFWKLDENGGVRVDDLGGYTFTESGGTIPYYWDGKVRTAADIDSAKFLYADNNPALQTGGNSDFSVSVWVYLDSTNNNQFILSKASNSRPEWEIWIAYSKFYFSTYKTVPPDLIPYNATSADVGVNSTGWFHIVGVHNATTNRNQIYVNHVAKDDVPAQETNNSGRLQVGARYTIYQSLDAKVDAVGFWKKVLTQTEVDTLYKSGYGLEYPFIVTASTPTVTTDAATAVTHNSAIANGTIVSIGDENAKYRGFEYGLSAPAYGTTITETGSFNTGAFTASLTNLRCNTLYHIRAYATNSAGTDYGDDVTFTTDDCINSVTIDSPIRYQVIQRNGGNQGNINVSGHYTNATGASTVIQAYWNGNPVMTLTTTPEVGWSNGGSFSGTLINQPAGQGTLTVKFATHIENDTVSDIGIGDIFAIAGQSNAMGYGLANQNYAGTLKASMFGNNDQWKELADPIDSSIGQVDAISSDALAAGSIWPLLATLIMADQNVPVAFVPAAHGSSYLEPYLTYTYWQRPVGWPPLNYPDTLYGSMYRRIQAVGGVKAVLYWQGENEAKDNYSQAAYYTSLNNFANNIFSDLGVKVSVAQIGDFCTTYCPPLGLDNIRLAQQQAWDSSSNVVIGPSLYDVYISDEGSDGLHFQSNTDMQIAANRWWVALKQAYYGGTAGRGPRIRLIEHVAGTAIFDLYFETASPLTSVLPDLQGFSVTEGGGILSAAITGTNKVTITTNAAASGAATVSYGLGRSANIGFLLGLNKVLTDSGTYNLPAEIFKNMATTVPDTNAPTFTIVKTVDAGPVTSDVINVTVSDLEGNLDVSTIKYGFSSDAICNAGDTYGNSFTSGIDFTITGTHLDYLCVTAADWPVNIGYQLVGKLNIPVPAAFGGQAPHYGQPGDVTNLVVKADSTGKITLTWQDPTDQDLKEIVITETLINFSTNTFIIAKGVETAIFTNRLVGSEYEYLIKARDTSGLESPGVFSEITVPAQGEVSGRGEEPMEGGAEITLPDGVYVGALVKEKETTTVYFIDADKRRHTFPNEPTFFSYFESFAGIKTLPASTLAQIAIGKNVTVRPGTWLVKIQTDPKVYALEPYGVLKYVSTVDLAKKLYGTGWTTKIIDISPAFFVDYQLGEPITMLMHPTETVIKYQNSSNIYYIDQGKKRLITSAVFTNNIFQNKFIIANFDQSISYPSGEPITNQKIEDIIAIR